MGKFTQAIHTHLGTQRRRIGRKSFRPPSASQPLTPSSGGMVGSSTGWFLGSDMVCLAQNSQADIPSNICRALVKYLKMHEANDKFWRKKPPQGPSGQRFGLRLAKSDRIKAGAKISIWVSMRSFASDPRLSLCPMGRTRQGFGSPGSR